MVNGTLEMWKHGTEKDFLEQVPAKCHHFSIFCHCQLPSHSSVETSNHVLPRVSNIARCSR